MLIFTSSDGGVAVGAFAPASAKLPNGALVNISTEYPYGDNVTVYLNVGWGVGENDHHSFTA